MHDAQVIEDPLPPELEAHLAHLDQVRID